MQIFKRSEKMLAPLESLYKIRATERSVSYCALQSATMHSGKASF